MPKPGELQERAAGQKNARSCPTTGHSVDWYEYFARNYNSLSGLSHAAAEAPSPMTLRTLLPQTDFRLR